MASENTEPPSFDEAREALTPPLSPGARPADLWDALKAAQVRTGNAPGHTVPDISMDYSRPIVTDLSGGGVRPEILKALSAGARSLDDVGEALATAQAGRAGPTDPFGVGHVAAVGLREMFEDMMGAGFTEDQATSILGKMLAAYGRNMDEGRQGDPQ